MHLRKVIAFVVVSGFLSVTSSAQTTRLTFNNQQLFLSGGNLAWMSFSSDIGPGPLDSTTFGDILLQIHNSGGNAVRWWLHTDGRNTPQFNDTGLVVGPGPNTISNLRHALDMAWEREIGVNLCLWSFDMMRGTNTATMLARNQKLLSDTAYIRAYIDNCLIPMVDSLKGHPAILAWEIFNEPEGMSTSYAFSGIQTVPDAYIQRFVNLCAGAIHRADPSAIVTNGAWSFKSLSTAAPASVHPGKIGLPQNQLTSLQLEREFKEKYRVSMTADQIAQYIAKVYSVQSYNWYSDNQLIAQGGDTLGTLDFYEVHYYSWGGIPLSPFHNAASYWGLSKPIVIAEFGITDFLTAFPRFATSQTLYNVLYQNNYAGALAWSWTDVGITTHADMLANIGYLWDNHRSDVDVLAGGVDWPMVTITSPSTGSAFPDSTSMTIRAMVIDTLAVDSVQFFVADTQRIGSVTQPDSTAMDTSYYSFFWKNILAGQYALKAVAANIHGHQGVSNLVQLSFGTPPFTRLEAEKATLQGDVGNILVANSASASGGAYLNIKTQDPNTTITWTFTNVAPADSYYVAFGYRLEYDHPKYQYVNINGARVTQLLFDGSSITTWYETGLKVYLVAGTNTIQMQLSWGWMDLDYLSVPTHVLTSVEPSSQLPTTFALLQNYPNPFNPTTTITYALPHAQRVRLRLFDLLGREVARIVEQQQNAGFHSVSFDATRLSSGVYFYRIEAGSFVQTMRMLLLK